MEKQLYADRPAVSIIIPCFNDGKFLVESVGSAERCQSETREIIVVNDGSTDEETLSILKEVESRGHQVTHQRNCGLASARNHGVGLAHGRYILPLDADNRVRPEYLEKGIEILDQRPEIDVVYGDAQLFGSKTGRLFVPEFNLCRLLEWNYIDACALFRRSAWLRCGMYDEKMPSMGYEDWDLWCRIALSGGQFHHINEVLYEYRTRPGSMSSGMGDPERVAAIMRHIRAKRLETTIGNYTDALHSWDIVVAEFRRRPFKTPINLLARAFFPKTYSKWQDSHRKA